MDSRRVTDATGWPLRALQEWKLLLPDEKENYQAAIQALRERLEPGNQTLAALDFRHRKLVSLSRILQDGLRRYIRLDLIEKICLKRPEKYFCLGSYTTVFHTS